MKASGTSEAEYVALSKTVQEVAFLRQVQDFMEPSTMIGPVNMFEDNEGAIKLTGCLICSGAANDDVALLTRSLRDSATQDTYKPDI